MGSKKKQTLQVDITSDEEFKEALAQPGLKVIDVYSQWCGPCKAVYSLLRKRKTESADDLLLMYTANADKVEALSDYKGTSEPQFLFYGGDVLVDMVKGANGPLLDQVIIEALAREHDALDNNTERVPYDDSSSGRARIASAAPIKARADNAAAADEAATTAAKEASKPAKAAKKEYTLAILKPDIAEQDEAVDIIFAMIAEANLHAIEQDEQTLEKEEAAAFYAEHKDKEFYDRLCDFMASGPCKPIILSGENVIKKWRELMGPTEHDEAVEKAPDSIRAQFGTANTENAVHGSDSEASAHREIEFFFPVWASENLPEQNAVFVCTNDAKDSVTAAITATGCTIDKTEDINIEEERAKVLAAGVEDDVPKYTGSFTALLARRIALAARLSALRGTDGIVFASASVEAAQADWGKWVPVSEEEEGKESKKEEVMDTAEEVKKEAVTATATVTAEAAAAAEGDGNTKDDDAAKEGEQAQTGEGGPAGEEKKEEEEGKKDEVAATEGEEKKEEAAEDEKKEEAAAEEEKKEEAAAEEEKKEEAAEEKKEEAAEEEKKEEESAEKPAE